MTSDGINCRYMGFLNSKLKGEGIQMFFNFWSSMYRHANLDNNNKRKMYLVKSSLTRRSRHSRSKLRKPNASPLCIFPVKRRYMAWNGRVEAMSIGNHSFVTYLNKESKVFSEWIKH